MDFVSVLEKEYGKRLRANSNYSIRAYARDLAVDQSSLTKILARKRAVTDSFILKVASNLKIPSAKLKSFLGSQKIKTPNYRSLEYEKFIATADWYHDAILELIDTESFQPNIKWVAVRLGLSQNLVKMAVKRLQEVGLLEITEDNMWTDKSKQNSIHPKKRVDEALKTYQKQILTNSVKAIDKLPLDQRSHTSITFSGSAQNIEKAKARIEQCRKEVASILSADDTPKEEVFQLQVSLFPVTKPSEDKL